MTFNEQILVSKLSIPIHPDLFISLRLSRLWSNMVKKRLTVVTAGTGHGNTALTAWDLGHADMTTPDETDRDFSRFIRYVPAWSCFTWALRTNRTPRPAWIRQTGFYLF